MTDQESAAMAATRALRERVLQAIRTRGSAHMGHLRCDERVVAAAAVVVATCGGDEVHAIEGALHQLRDDGRIERPPFGAWREVIGFRDDEIHRRNPGGD